MPNLAIIGGQWGDEGKGKLVDLMADRFDLVVRFQGGHNAGHTVTIHGKVTPLHLIPSGVFHPKVTCVLGNGVVVHPPTFLAEVQGLEDAGVRLAGRLWVSDRAHIVMPYHPLLDVAREAARGDKKIGTTSRGIGPSYEDKVARKGLRGGDLHNLPRLREWILRNLEEKNRLLEALGTEPLEPRTVLAEMEGIAEKMGPYVVDTVELLHDAVEAGRSILLEGAQGSLLDVDFGTFPYVTSSNTCAGGIFSGSGLPPSRLDGLLMVLKAYCTRVGSGPFPTELANELGDRIRERGREYGTTTRRPRRIGWFDAVAARHSVRLNGPTGIALTLLDVLEGLDEVRVAVAYRIRGEVARSFPADPWALREVEPVYESLPGWQGPTSGITNWEELPGPARDYVAFLERSIGAVVALISTGPDRSPVIRRRGARLWKLFGE